jgi:hypothetical protein
VAGGADRLSVCHEAGVNHFPSLGQRRWRLLVSCFFLKMTLRFSGEETHV